MNEMIDDTNLGFNYVFPKLKTKVDENTHMKNMLKLMKNKIIKANSNIMNIYITLLYDFINNKIDKEKFLENREKFNKLTDMIVFDIEKYHEILKSIE